MRSHYHPSCIFIWTFVIFWIRKRFLPWHDMTFASPQLFIVSYTNNPFGVAKIVESCVKMWACCFLKHNSVWFYCNFPLLLTHFNVLQWTTVHRCRARFRDILKHMWFDNWATRAGRQDTNKSATFRGIWTMFLLQLPKYCIPVTNLCLHGASFKRQVKF